MQIENNKEKYSLKDAKLLEVKEKELETKERDINDKLKTIKTE